MYEFIGFTAGIIFTLATVPQVRYCIRTKDVQSLNLAMIVMLNMGSLMNILYASLSKQYIYLVPMILSEGLYATLLYLKVTFTDFSESSVLIK